jgi:hypothetical protein
MLQEVALDAHEGEQILVSKREQLEHQKQKWEQEQKDNRERFWKRWGLGGLFLGAAGSIHHIGDAMIGYHYADKAWLIQLLKGDGKTAADLQNDPRLQEVVRLYLEAHHWEGWLLIVVVVGGLFLGYAAYREGKKPGGGH